jgi:hypothetical protein
VSSGILLTLDGREQISGSEDFWHDPRVIRTDRCHSGLSHADHEFWRDGVPRDHSAARLPKSLNPFTFHQIDKVWHQVEARVNEVAAKILSYR